MTYRESAYSLLEIFKQNFDDADISLNHMIYWILVVSNKIRAQHVMKNPSGQHLNIFSAIPVETVLVDSKPNDIADRKRITLPASVIDMSNDAGIDYLSYDLEYQCDGSPMFTKVIFSRTTPSKSHRLYWNDFEKPAANNPYFYRVEDYLYLLGLEKVSVKTLEIGLFFNIRPGEVCDLDEQIRLPDELIEVMMYQVMALGRFSIQIPRDRINEGSDSAVERATQKEVEIPELPTTEKSKLDKIKTITE